MDIASEKLLTEEQISEQLYQDYNSSDRKTFDDNVAKDLAFMQNNMWENEDADALEANNEPALAINEVKPSIDLVVSMLTENNPRWQFVGADMYDSNAAGDVSALHEHIWEVSNGTQVLENTVYDYEVMGIGAFMAYIDPFADYGKGEIKIIDIDPRTLFVDPMCKQTDTNDSPHKMIVKNLTESQIRDQFPEFFKKHFTEGRLNLEMVSADDFATSLNSAPEGQVENVRTLENKYRAIDRYTRIKEARFHVTDTVTGYDKILTQEQFQAYINEPAFIETRLDSENYITETSQVRQAMNLYEQTGGVYHFMLNPESQQVEMMPGAEHGQFSIPASTVKLTPVTKQDLIPIGVIRVENPTVNRIRRIFTIGRSIVVDEVYPIEDYPIVTYMLHSQRNPYPMSDVRLTRPLQQQLNKVRSKITAYLSTLTGLDVFVQKGSGLKSKLEENMGKAGLKVHEVDMEVGSPPVVAQRPPLPAGVYEDSFNIINQIQRIIGAYAASDGNVESMPRTKGGTILQDEFGQRRVNLKRKRLERALNQISKVISQMIPHVYSEEKIVRIVTPNRKNPKEVKFNAVDEAGRLVNDLSIRYDVRVVSGSTMPTNQLMRYDMMNNAYAQGVLRDNTLVLQNMPFVDNIDEIIEREDRLKQLEQALGQAQEQIKQLSGQLQTKSREVIQAQEKVAVEKTKTNLDKLVNKAESAVLLGQARIGDEVKKKKENNKPERNAK